MMNVLSTISYWIKDLLDTIAESVGYNIWKIQRFIALKNSSGMIGALNRYKINDYFWKYYQVIFRDLGYEPNDHTEAIRKYGIWIKANFTFEYEDQ